MATPTPPAKRGLSRNARIGIGIVGAFILIVVIGRFTAGTGVDESDGSSSASAASTSSSAPAAAVVSDEDLEQIFQAQELLDRANYNTLTEREFALLVKDPESRKGERVVIYGKVTQFDAATGNDAFRADTGPLPPDSGERYSQNSVITVVDPRTVADVVEDDYLKMYAVVSGAYTYKTQIGGENTAPLFSLYIVDNLSAQIEQRQAGS
ncbi:hypothetical protein [Mycolicibacterium goodii]|uniref:hypothetical protein n=1 Tax=Mycolicibacterium goodii TaxID=134601 RepID=UPI001BDD271B|nr:hypothetical protein [Mycolicibacterium goodii]MBU8833370.1 hypothetical protein [Mycolicibacterium goodii]